MDSAVNDFDLLQNRYQKKRKQEIEASHVTATFLGVVVFPAFAILDYLTQRQYFWDLALVRLLLTSIFVFAHSLARRGIRPGGVTTTATTLLFVASAGITALCLVTGGLTSPYYGGINLLIFTCVTFPPGTFRQTITACVGIIFFYVAGILLFQSDWQQHVPMLINNLFFQVITTVIGLTSALFHERLRYEAFIRLVAAEDADEVRKAHAAVSRALGIRDEFISIASHELLTPITSMRLQNDIVKRELARSQASPTLSLWVSRNERYISRLMRLIDDMLDVARVNTGHLKLECATADLGECVSEMTDRFKNQFEQAKVEVRLEIAASAIGHWDRFRLEQVVANLFSNVVKYAPGKPLEISVEVVGAEAQIRVADHGRGIKTENLEKIFDRFERADPPAGASGLGLGLYISKKIVEGHDGKIWVEPSEGGGSTFVVSLPLGTSPGLQTEVRRNPPESQNSAEPQMG